MCVVFCVTTSCSSPRIQAEEKKKDSEIPKYNSTFLAGTVRVGRSPARRLQEGGILECACELLPRQQALLGWWCKTGAQPMSESEGECVDELTEPTRGQPRLTRVTQPTRKASEA
jgi:hypothetical protein